MIRSLITAIQGMFHDKERHADKDIKIAGIYRVCSELRLPKWGPPRDEKMLALAAMTSGKVALYRYHDWMPAVGVDWGWHTFRFQRYAEPSEIATLPWLTSKTEPHRPNQAVAPGHNGGSEQ